MLITDDYETFLKLDLNKDGYVSREEFLGTAEKNGVTQVDGQDIKDLFQDYDFYKDNKISLGEYLLYNIGGGKDAKEMYEARLIYTLGYGENGEFSPSLGQTEANKILEKYDLNKDRIITVDEIKAVEAANAKVNQQTKSESLSAGAIIGIVIGCIAVAGLIVALIYFLTKDNKKEVKKKDEKIQYWKQL